MLQIDRLATAGINLFIFSTALGACVALLMVNDRPFSASASTVRPTALRDIDLD
jgi:hypothetical protein